jgi:hypothetical protein
VTCVRFSADTAVSSLNKTDRHDITEVLLKVKHHNPPKTHLLFFFGKKKKEIYHWLSLIYPPLKKAVGHLIPFMEEERQLKMASGEIDDSVSTGGYIKLNQ